MSELSLGKLKGLTVNSNVVTVPSGHSFYAPGHVIQVQSITKVDSWTTTSGTYSDVTGLSVDITPKFSSSKILVIATVSMAHVTSNDGFVQLVRGSTPLGNGTFGSLSNGFAQVSSSYPNSIINQNITYLDSPTSTSTQTYKIQGKIYSSGTFCINRRGVDGSFGTSSSITVMEIAA